MYKRILLSTIAVVSVLTLNACGFIFNPLTSIGDKKIKNPAIVNQLVEGKSTIADSEKILGTPQMLSHRGDETELDYYFQENTGIIGAGTETTNLNLTFDKNGVLKKKYSYKTGN